MEVSLNIPEELAELLREVETRDERALLVEAVCGLYSRCRIGAGRAARLLGMSRHEFREEVAKRGIPIQHSLEELRHDIAFARGQ